MAKVLFIEDEESLLSFYTDLLQSEGHTVYSASDGEKGLQLALNNDWEIMFLDIMLPGMDGLSILRKLNESGKISDRKIYIFSNISGSELVSECLRNGAKGHLKKAEITPDQIIDLIQSPKDTNTDEDNI